MPANKKQAWKARLLVPCLDPACGASLYEPLAAIENGVILAEHGIISAIGANLAIPHDYELIDYGDSIICPSLVNAHTHLQLSWLQGETSLGHGFTDWLKSMLPQLLPVIGSGFGPMQEAAFRDAVLGLIACGTGYAGDIGGSIPGALAAALSVGFPMTHFCEWFGFLEDSESIWPARCQAEVGANPDARASCAPCGHALYSTSVKQMQRVQAWCEESGVPFTFHLAESPEETEMLASGTGPLVDLYRGIVLPDNWRPEGLAPVRMASKYGLLNKNTLAVHGVQMDGGDIKEFAETGAALCLCPRSNRNLSVGTAPVRKFIEADILLCLGTDGLASCADLDIRNEVAFLQEEFDLPMSVLLRMAIANGRAALGLGQEWLAIGRQARFSVWPLRDPCDA